MLLTLSISAANSLALQASGIRVATDRTWYLSGETMTVSVTADNALIAYAELCDTHGLAAGVMVGLKGGKGTGKMELPPDLHSGYYLLSAYTRGNAHVFQQLVAVVNPLRKSVDDDMEWVETNSLTPNPSPTGEGSNYIVGENTSEEVSTPLPLWGEAGSETEGHIIQARVRNDYDGQTFRASQIRPSLSVVGKQIHFFEGKMVNDSIAVFYTYGVHGRLPLVLSAMSSTGVSLPIEIISPFAALLPNQLPHLVFHYNRSEVEARSLDMQRSRSHTSHLTPHTSHLTPHTSSLSYDETVFGTHPDLSYNLDEYRQFLTIREVLLEYVKCVSKKKVNGVSQLFVRKEQEIYNTSMPTLVLIDGMSVFDVEQLLSYDARRVHYINIYGGQYTFGNGIYNGILSIVTRSGQLTNYPIEHNMQYLEYDFPN